MKKYSLVMVLLFLVKFLSACGPHYPSLPPPVNAINSLNSAEAYLAQGDRYSENHAYDQAIAEYDRAITLKPDYAEAYNNRGFAFYSKNKASLAIVDFNNAIELRPDYAYAYNNRGVAYLASGYIDQSIHDFDRAIQLQPNFPQAYTNRGNAFLRKGRLDLAIKDYHRAGKNLFGLIALRCGLPVVIVLLGTGIIYRIARKRFQAKRRNATTPGIIS
jgi:tetratricopeptide (TPR) repeat protein